MLSSPAKSVFTRRCAAVAFSNAMQQGIRNHANCSVGVGAQRRNGSLLQTIGELWVGMSYGFSSPEEITARRGARLLERRIAESPADKWPAQFTEGADATE
jgi:hypothetical protein